MIPLTISSICLWIMGSPPGMFTIGAPASSATRRHSSTDMRLSKTCSYSRMRPHPWQARLQISRGSSMSVTGKRASRRIRRFLTRYVGHSEFECARTVGHGDSWLPRVPGGRPDSSPPPVASLPLAAPPTRRGRRGPATPRAPAASPGGRQPELPPPLQLSPPPAAGDRRGRRGRRGGRGRDGRLRRRACRRCRGCCRRPCCSPRRCCRRPCRPGRGCGRCRGCCRRHRCRRCRAVRSRSTLFAPPLSPPPVPSWSAVSSPSPAPSSSSITTVSGASSARRRSTTPMRPSPAPSSSDSAKPAASPPSMIAAARATTANLPIIVPPHVGSSRTVVDEARPGW